MIRSISMMPNHAIYQLRAPKIPLWKAAAFVAGLGLSALSYPVHAALASGGDIVRGLYDTLLSTMKNGRTLGQSFGRYLSAIYADRFDNYAGQRLEVTGEQPAPSGIMVKSQIIKASGEPVKVDYMMRRNGEGWLISDIYLDGAISEVATRRSEFSYPEAGGHRRADRGPQPQGRYPHRDNGKILLRYAG